MPYPLTLPTTSTLHLPQIYESATHPSLPLTATTLRSILKDALKKHKRLPSREKALHLPLIHDALTNYLPYLLALNSAAGFGDVGAEQNVDLGVKGPLVVEWRCTLTATTMTTPGLEAPRVKLVGLHYELAFTLATLAATQTLRARAQLKVLFDGSVITAEQRTSAITGAMKFLLEAYGVYQYLLSLPSVGAAAAAGAPVDVQPATLSGLAALALAEATLVVVAKDDPFAAAVAEERNEGNREWMYRAPAMPKVRAHLFARIALAAAEHAGAAQGLLRGVRGLDEGVWRYAGEVRRCARGKAARFLGVDGEVEGGAGLGLAWLKGARGELGEVAEEGGRGKKGLRGLKAGWKERREERKVEGGGEWGLDGGRLEEVRVVAMLEAKWERENRTVNVQPVPAWEPLIASMPSGREYHSPQPWTPPVLDAGTLTRMRVPPDPDEAAFRGEEPDSGDDGDGGKRYGLRSPDPVGAFPGTGGDYGARSGTSTSYY
ncbi:hypothetical protein B0A50_08060 [Salinomyces thailandicus]|uniref:pH-response regulator protein palC n=1 Tax=Salinomyces thailandicus TaxID=706561 RepID=A0A4U0TKU9_9PEZI|nr:hypothetical protein B0A50_08060 [Salinomyces thailandica]